MRLLLLPLLLLLLLLYLLLIVCLLLSSSLWPLPHRPEGQAVHAVRVALQQPNLWGQRGSVHVVACQRAATMRYEPDISPCLYYVFARQPHV